jgi:tRNA threonylcarbamoyladenosine dehydratase
VIEAAGLAIDRARRFGGVGRLYGAQGAAQIFASHVVVIGIGGVGSWSAEALARSGVGRITLIDMDHVSESNINRQLHALDSTLGQAKIEAMKVRIHAINPECMVNTIDDFVTPENWPALASQISMFAPMDAVIDACDQVIAKTAMAAWALQHPKTIFICVGAAGGKQQGELVQMDDLSLTTHDPLLAKMRYNLRRSHGAKRDGKMSIACVFSKEAVAPPQSEIQNDTPNDDFCEVAGSDGTLNCSGFGSSVAVTATFGMCAAGFVLKVLAKPNKSAL